LARARYYQTLLGGWGKLDQSDDQRPVGGADRRIAGDTGRFDRCDA